MSSCIGVTEFNRSGGSQHGEFHCTRMTLILSRVVFGSVSQDASVYDRYINGY